MAEAAHDDNSASENVPMRISNDPTQHPYRGKFAASRALDEYGFKARDLAYATTLIKYSEQAHVNRAELKVHERLHKEIDMIKCDALSYWVQYYILEGFPEASADRAQSLRAQYEGAVYPQDYYFSDFVALLVEINTELTKISERYSYDPKDLFMKVKVVMMASFNEFDRGDALQRRYCKLAEILGEYGDENQSVNDKRFCEDFPLSLIHI